MEPTLETSSKQSSGKGAVIGSLAALYVLVCLCIGAAVYLARQQIPGIQAYFPKPTATPTSTPITHQPASGDQVFKDDFSNNKNVWSGETNPPTDVQFNNGKLNITSLKAGSFGSVYCRACPLLTSPYFVQAEFSTDRSIDEAYGLAFSSEKYHDSYYLFEINPQAGRYDLYKYGPDWTLRSSRNSTLIKPYPNINLLGVSLDHDLIVMYINGQVVDTYQDTGNAINSGIFWPFADNAGFTLYVDNLFAYGR